MPGSNVDDAWLGPNVSMAQKPCNSLTTVGASAFMADAPERRSADPVHQPLEQSGLNRDSGEVIAGP